MNNPLAVPPYFQRLRNPFTLSAIARNRPSPKPRYDRVEAFVRMGIIASRVRPRPRRPEPSGRMAAGAAAKEFNIIAGNHGIAMTTPVGTFTACEIGHASGKRFNGGPLCQIQKSS